ncbi:ribonuclease Y [Stratiformator vulcanicus]|uniref:Ribonuclease Y n=1 Tax=Stratiformator vulcanicus TaxID=2527980 RepID=A0A517R2H3_9PLAN|nr:ribonuclease Y [Stratiformator vulcanicus]QDT38080.1 Ribonuclease Y [Stratiformator vulcanicus]
MNDYVIGAIALVVGCLLGFFFDRLRRGAAYKDRDAILADAEREGQNLLKSKELEAKELLLKRREEAEKELDQDRDELRRQEKRLDKREAMLDESQEAYLKKERMLETQQKKISDRGKAMDSRQKELDRVLREEQDLLHKISELDKPKATELLLDRLDKQLRDETGALLLKHQSEIKEQCDQQAREIIGMAVQRYAAPHTSETTVSTVDIPSDEMKGRIIGREGRNIRAFEKATGVDVVVDDTPGVVVVSAFDSVRREIGKLALQKLIEDGRIHPTRIEEVVEETQKEMDAHIRKMGIEASQEAGLTGLHEKILDLMGRLQFRTSYSQNVRRHSIEVAHLTGLMAEQLGLDGDMARRCGFLHDIGKAADHEMEGGHPAVGAELLKRYGEGDEVVHAARGHHDDIRPEYIFTVLVAAADAVSAARPGARRETLEKYVRRLEELEALANGFPGVDHCYAVQAGREIRIVVDATAVNDREAAKMSKEIADAIEQTLTYPGEIKVSVLRETRSIEFAR